MAGFLLDRKNRQWIRGGNGLVALVEGFAYCVRPLNPRAVKNRGRLCTLVEIDPKHPTCPSRVSVKFDDTGRVGRVHPEDLIGQLISPCGSCRKLGAQYWGYCAWCGKRRNTRRARPVVTRTALSTAEADRVAKMLALIDEGTQPIVAARAARVPRRLLSDPQIRASIAKVELEIEKKATDLGLANELKN